MKTIIISVDHIDETGKYWADSTLKYKHVNWRENETIHKAITSAIENADCCTFSYNGKPQGNVYQDRKDGATHITGYHYRTKHYIESRSDNIQKDNVPFTTWVTIHGELTPLELQDLENA